MSDTIDREAFDVTIDHQRCHLDEITPEQDLWENHGFLLRADASDGTDVTLWTSPYIVKRGPHSYYASEMDILQTVLVATNYSAAEKRQMHDNDFVAVGWNVADYLPRGTVQADRNDERVLWKILGREYEDAPPHWEARGEHGGVDLDLAFDAFVPSFPLFPHEGFAEEGMAWYEVYLRAGGTIAHAGRRLEVSGYACHERVIVTRDHEPQKMRGHGLNWHHLFGDRVQSWIMTSPSAAEGLAYVVVDGETFKVQGAERVRIDDTDHWVDPRSWFRVPYRWHVTVETDGGALELDAGAYARAYYPWVPFRDTVNILYWMSAEASGTFTRSDGDVIEIPPAKYMAHSNRVIFERQ
ncbi:MAG TPA: hypothetical protein VGM91_10265 [Conexibacter sp.]|jgi:hypothetical protein